MEQLLREEVKICSAESETRKRLKTRILVCREILGRIDSLKGEAYRRLTWQGLGNASIHVCLVLMVAYAVCIAAYGIGRQELRQSVAFFA